jgi:hypothetical protein
MIEKYSFGKIVVNGVAYTNDIKIVKGRVVSDWWRKRGHSVDIEDIQPVNKAGLPRITLLIACYTETF